LSSSKGPKHTTLRNCVPKVLQSQIRRHRPFCACLFCLAIGILSPSFFRSQLHFERHAKALGQAVGGPGEWVYLHKNTDGFISEHADALSELLDFYNRRFQMNLTGEEKEQLIAFLNSL
jgi:hypothetical protein